MKPIIIQTEADRQRAISALLDLKLTEPGSKTADGKPRKPARYRVEIKLDRASRSVAQNRLLWMWYGEMQKHIAAHMGQQWDTLDMHDSMVAKFRPRVPVVDPITSEILGMKRQETKKWGVAEFSEYLNELEIYCADSLNLLLPRPDDLYWEALGAPNRERA